MGGDGRIREIAATSAMRTAHQIFGKFRNSMPWSELMSKMALGWTMCSYDAVEGEVHAEASREEKDEINC